MPFYEGGARRCPGCLRPVRSSESHFNEGAPGVIKRVWHFTCALRRLPAARD